MTAKVIIAQATEATAEVLTGLVKRVSETTSIKAYPHVDNGAVFFPADRYDKEFVERVLSDKGISFEVDDAE